MENSPLELYDKAYRLHYVENNVVQAGQLYEALIKEFPESNECGYAVIQLQKIHAREVVDSIEALRRKGHPLLLVSVVLNIVTLLAVVAVAVLFLTDQRAPASGLSAAAPTSSAVVPPPPPPPPGGGAPGGGGGGGGGGRGAPRPRPRPLLSRPLLRTMRRLSRAAPNRSRPWSRRRRKTPPPQGSGPHQPLRPVPGRVVRPRPRIAYNTSDWCHRHGSETIRIRQIGQGLCA